jgi:hypothetical protein
MRLIINVMLSGFPSLLKSENERGKETILVCAAVEIGHARYV